MKLKKEICKKCWDNVWPASDDEMWEQGRLHCRYIVAFSNMTKIISIESIPDECRYKLEHIVVTQNEIK